MNENLEIVEMQPCEEEKEEIMESNEHSGKGTVLAMMIGGGLTLAAVAGGRKLKELWNKRKSKKEQTDDFIETDAYEVVNDSIEGKDSN